MNAEEQRNAQLRREVAQLRERIHVLAHSESERRFRGAFEFAAFGMALLNDKGHFIKVNQSLCQMFGYPEQELLTKTFKDVTYPEDLAVGSELFQDLLSGKRDFGWLEKRYVHKDGHILWAFLSTSAIRDPQGQLNCLVSQIQDITARKQVEAELTHYREQLETLVEVRTAELQKEIAERKRAEEEAQNIAKFPAENPNPVMRIAQDGRVLYANPPSLCLLKAWGCQVNQQLTPNWLEFTIRVFQARTNQAVEVQCPGCQRIYSLTFVPVVEAGYINIYGLDITMRKQSEKELQRAKDDLEVANRQLEKRVQEELKKREKQQHLLIQRSKLESLGKLAAGIAHEINQPLAGISMGLDNIALKLSSGKATEGYLRQKIEALFQHVDRIKHIIEHIRTFSRNQATIEIERVDVNAVCRNAISLLQTQYQNHHIIFTLNLDDTLGFVIGNSYKLEQVLLNFLTNAKDAVDAKEQGTASAAYQKQISLITCCDDDRIYLEVQDNGLGICKEELDNIFDPFFTTKDPAHGTGLGLSVSYGIIKDMHGDIQVQSEPGAYTRMTISLPRVT